MESLARLRKGYKSRLRNRTHIENIREKITDKEGLPDFIEGKWTEKNSNPATMEYTYKAGTQLPVWCNSHDQESIRTDFGRWGATWMAKNLFGVLRQASILQGFNKANLLLSQKLYDKFILDAFLEAASWAQALTSILWVYMDVFNVIVSIKALVDAIQIAQNANEHLIGYIVQWLQEIEEAKRKCDNSYDPETGEYRIKGFKITLTARFDVEDIIMAQRVIKYHARGYKEFVCLDQDCTIGLSKDKWIGLTDVEIKSVQI